MVQYNPLQYLPSAEELPDSDDTPVDNELQTLVPNLLRFILGWLWAERFDWFFGINMGVYYPTAPNPRVAVVPDAFLCLGVERSRGERLRRSYVVWEENNVIPLLTLEVVSQTPGGEYDEKMTIYAQMGVLYYVVYNPDFWQRDKHEPFEVYRLVAGEYQHQMEEPFFFPEVGLGIGRSQGVHGGLQREWLFWYDQQGNRLRSPDERTQQAEQRIEQTQQQLEQERQRTQQAEQRTQQAEQQAEQERQRAEQERREREELIARLLKRGINPEDL
ncbi:MAG: Uma2 family endonuclease [Chroococcidiopsidaceae cyanobacterium CP_BM_RX_35]|nr:Uma2 family endonuclease [Chroococcidiopsidaceae cyanobacterium CP_BM_RX_35]